MYLLDLPVEIGALIFKYLDIKSKINSYTIQELRKFYIPSVMRKFDVTRCSAASVKTLDLDLFHDLAANIHELNLSGIVDLTASQLSHHIQTCSNLKTLDITFTSIYLSDLNDVIICPESLKSISVNFFKMPRRVKGKKVWKRSIEFFQRHRFEYVHFIIEYVHFINSAFDLGFPLLFMKDVPRTKSLKITVAHSNNYRNFRELRRTHGNSERNMIDVNFEKLNYVFRDATLRIFDGSAPCGLGVSNINFKQIEYIYFKEFSDDRRNRKSDETSFSMIIYVSPIFSSLFTANCSNLEIVVTQLPEFNFVDRSMLFKAWNKSFTTFDDAFFETVLTELKDYFPTYLCMHNKIQMKVTEVPSNWYSIDACHGFERMLDKLPEKVTLTNFCRKEGCMLRTNRPVDLTSQWNTLKNITFLRLSNICLGEDFFTSLFEQCQKLYTLDAYIVPGVFEGCSLSLPNSMHLTKSLRNIRLHSMHVDFEQFFASLCQCPTLENIHIISMDGIDTDTQNMILLIENCPDLYSVFIEADMSPERLAVLETPMRAAAQRPERDFLRIEVWQTFESRWNPFGDVFSPSPFSRILL